VEPSGRDWRKFLTQGVSLKTVLLAFVPVVAWIAFLFLFVSVYRAVVHVQGPAGVALEFFRNLVELGTVVIALRYFFQILQRGMARDLSIDSKERP